MTIGAGDEKLTLSKIEMPGCEPGLKNPGVHPAFTVPRWSVSAPRVEALAGGERHGVAKDALTIHVQLCARLTVPMPTSPALDVPIFNDVCRQE